MSTNTSERAYQQDIVDYLRSTGYVDRTTYNSKREVELYSKKSNYNKGSCLDVELVLKFVKDTQPNAWKKFVRVYKEDSEVKFIDSLIRQLNNKGTIDVLKNGFRDVGTDFKLYYPKPNSNINESLEEKFSKNILSVIQEVSYQKDKDKGNRVDLVIFVNGLPISTIELKDTFSQGVEKAIKQYMTDRNPNETLFKRCMVHFAMSDEKIYMTTKLKGQDTYFLPFNKGLDNPNVENDYRTSYLYKDILQPNQLSNLISNFIFYEDDTLIFPRYHQLECVNMLVESASPGKNFLIQHSAGSGKTKTIAWLAHRLKNKFDEKGNRVYDLIIIISDRRVIDEQLQDQVLAIQKNDGTVTAIGDKKTSKDLAEAMHTSKNIVVSTIHKFSYIKDLVSDLPDRNYAIIVDEAHSSQTGKHAHDVKIVTGTNTCSDEFDEEEFDDEDEQLLKQMEKIRNNSNLSYFAFTATPKNKTLELFGQKYDDGTFHPHHIYSMKQAIEEDFILDVLKNYITYPTYWKLAKKVEDDPEFDKTKAMKVLVGFVEEHPTAIHDKVKIILEHFNNSTKHKIKGRARAMIVTRSRKAAVLYKLELDRQIKNNNYDDINALVAFTGTVKHDTVEYTENSLNGIKGDIKEIFKDDPNRLLVVADKYQTGFDEPLLHTMYVDKKLRSVKAVQTLSRVNRMHPDKKDTLIIDFVNTKEEILKAFEPYYKDTSLSEETDYRKLYDLMGLILDEGVYTTDDTDDFYKKYSENVSQQELHNIINESVDNFKALNEEQQDNFKKSIRRFQNTYGFLCQLLPFSDISLEKMYIYNKYLYKKLPTFNNPLPYSVLEDVDMETYTIDTRDEGDSIILQGLNGELNPSGSTAGTYKPGEEERLSAILEDLNERYGSIFKEENVHILKQIVDKIFQNDDIIEMLRNKNNSDENFEAVFDEILKEVLFEIFKTNKEFFKTINTNNEAKNDLKTYLIKYTRENYKKYLE